MPISCHFHDCSVSVAGGEYELFGRYTHSTQAEDDIHSRDGVGVARDAVRHVSQ